MRRIMGCAFAVLSCSTVIAAEAIVAESSADLFRNGKKETVRVVLKEGKRYHDEELWCGQGWKDDGKFTVTVVFPDGKTKETALNPLWSPEQPDDSLFFRIADKESGPWEIQFVDYNHDGVMDFNLGQYRDCNGLLYKLLSFRPDGTVYVIPLKSDSGSNEIYLRLGASDSSQSENSTTNIHLTEKGFSESYYNNTLPGGVTVFYEWDNKQHLFYAARLEEEKSKADYKLERVVKTLDRQSNKYVIVSTEVIDETPPYLQAPKKSSEHAK